MIDAGVQLPALLAFGEPVRVRKGAVRVRHIVSRDPQFGFIGRTALCGSSPASGFYVPAFGEPARRCDKCERRFAAAVVRALTWLAGGTCR